MTPIVRPHAVCETSAAICPRCGQVLVGRMQQRPEGSVVTCLNRFQGEACGQRVVVLANSGGMCTVVGVTRQEFDVLMAEDTLELRDVLRELGVIVGRVA